MQDFQAWAGRGNRTSNVAPSPSWLWQRKGPPFIACTKFRRVTVCLVGSTARRRSALRRCASGSGGGEHPLAILRGESRSGLGTPGP